MPVNFLATSSLFRKLTETLSRAFPNSGKYLSWMKVAYSFSNKRSVSPLTMSFVIQNGRIRDKVVEVMAANVIS
jgi:hypothetical protein